MQYIVASLKESFLTALRETLHLTSPCSWLHTATQEQLFPQLRAHIVQKTQQLFARRVFLALLSSYDIQQVCRSEA